MLNGKFNWRTRQQKVRARDKRMGKNQFNGPRSLNLELLEPRHLLATLIAQWDFDEGQGTAVSDASGNGFSGQRFGPTWVQQGSGYAIEFDGRDDYAQFATSQAMGLGGPLTLETWVMPTVKANGAATLMGEDLNSYLLMYSL